MSLKYRKKVLLLKSEVTYGTDPVPTGVANAILASNVNITPFQSDQVKRETVQAFLGAREAFQTGVHVALEFDVEIAGGGAAGTAPGYGPALLACAWAETINAGVSAVYDPVSALEGSAAIYFHMDGQKHSVLGFRGSVDLKFTAKALPFYHVSGIGLYVAPAATADPTPTLTAFQTPLTVGNVNTPTLTLHGFAAVTEELTLTQGNQVTHRELVGTESVQITDREMAGSITIEAPALGTKDFFAIAKAETRAALQVVHGTVAGNIVQVDAPNVQLLNPRYSESDGIVMLQMDLNLVPTAAGDDELSITVK